MKDKRLTKDEIKAIKRGQAYRNWNRPTWFVNLLTVTWFFCAIPFAHINHFTKVIYIIVAMILLFLEIHFNIMTSWKCPKCKQKLPSKDIYVGRGVTVSRPIFIKECPHCKNDLTK